jgi:hypothetical protein
MSTLREAAQQALEALEQCGLDDTHRSYEFEHVARIALRAALAQEEAPKGGGNLPPPLQAVPVQEPVAWMTHTNDLLPLFHKNRKAALNWQTQPTPLYTTPPRREWCSLSEEEIDRWTPEIHPVIRAIEQALKEKNA